MSRKVVALIGSLVTVGGFLVFALFPREVCGCISPNMRFRELFGISAAEAPARVRGAVLAKLPAGSDAAVVQAACEEINRSVGEGACTTKQAGVSCSCAFRTESSLFGWYERSVELRFETNVDGRLTDVVVERTSSLF